MTADNMKPILNVGFCPPATGTPYSTFTCIARYFALDSSLRSAAPTMLVNWVKSAQILR